MNSIQKIDVQGHRGCRGLMPENTLDGFVKAIEIGVTTLEMDVVISKDKKVVVSHEAFFNHEITTLPDGNLLTEKTQESYNIYTMTYNEIKKIDVGMKPHPRFPDQKKIYCIKPLLSDVIEICDSISKNKIHYNIEIKRKKDADNEFNPPVEEFVDIVCNEVLKKGIADRTTIQSFDHESIYLVHKRFPSLKPVLLIEDINSPDSHLKKIGFIPYAYSPYYKLVNEDLLKYCKEKKMKLIPWTVNDEVSINQLLELKVDGIISDYPDLVLKIIKDKSKN